MITPRFEVTQDGATVTVHVKIPYVRVDDIDFDVDELVFKLSVPPYFLRLNFPHGVLIDGRESAEYDYDSGVLKVSHTLSSTPKLVEEFSLILGRASYFLIAPHQLGD
jgi:protein SHQ1